MHMTDEQRYSAVLKELGEVLQSKNTTISCLQWEIDQLKEKLAEAEKQMADDAKNIAVLNAERDCVLHELEVAEKRLGQAHDKIDALEEKLAGAEYQRDEAIAELKALHKGGAKK